MIHRNFLIILVGLPSSGKSTIAAILQQQMEKRNDKFRIEIVDPDKIRNSLTPNKFDYKKEGLIRKKSLKKVKNGLRNGSIVISDDLNYYTSMRHDLKEIAEKYEKRFFIVHIATPLEKCIEWNKNRGLPIPQEVVQNIYEKFDLFNQYNWDKPLMTIDPSKTENLEKEVNNLINLIEGNLEKKAFGKHSKRKKSEQERYHEKVDKITRNLITEISRYDEFRPFMKKISKMRKEFIKINKDRLFTDMQISEELFKFIKKGLKSELS
ncbi:MAG: AAA family ATPase [Candidatus Hodarchaeota archaeon]